MKASRLAGPTGPLHLLLILKLGCIKAFKLHWYCISTAVEWIMLFHSVGRGSPQGMRPASSAYAEHPGRLSLPLDQSRQVLGRTSVPSVAVRFHSLRGVCLTGSDLIARLMLAFQQSDDVEGGWVYIVVKHHDSYVIRCKK